MSSKIYIYTHRQILLPALISEASVYMEGECRKSCLMNLCILVLKYVIVKCSFLNKRGRRAVKHLHLLSVTEPL